MTLHGHTRLPEFLVRELPVACSRHGARAVLRGEVPAPSPERMPGIGLAIALHLNPVLGGLSALLVGTLITSAAAVFFSSLLTRQVLE